MKRFLSILAFTSLALNNATAGDVSEPSLLDYPPPPSASPWEFEFSPYFWLANMKGTMAVGGVKSPVSIGFDDILEELDFAFMATGGVAVRQLEGRVCPTKNVRYHGDMERTPGEDENSVNL
jgi:hypothetical protein